MRKTILALLLICLCCTSAMASEPVFMGLYWGDSLNSLGEVKEATGEVAQALIEDFYGYYNEGQKRVRLTEKDLPNISFKVYTRVNEIRSLGTVPVSEVLYGFINGSLAIIHITSPEADRLRAIVQARYGRLDSTYFRIRSIKDMLDILLCLNDEINRSLSSLPKRGSDTEMDKEYVYRLMMDMVDEIQKVEVTVSEFWNMYMDPREQTMENESSGNVHEYADILMDINASIEEASGAETGQKYAKTILNYVSKSMEKIDRLRSELPYFDVIEKPDMNRVIQDTYIGLTTTTRNGIFQLHSVRLFDEAEDVLKKHKQEKEEAYQKAYQRRLEAESKLW